MLATLAANFNTQETKRRKNMSQNFSCIRNFETLKARKKTQVLVGDNSDVRNARFLFRSRIEANHPSQRHYRFPKGYIRFENQEYFDLSDQTLTSQYVPVLLDERKSVCIFLWTKKTALFWFQQIEKEKIRGWMRSASEEDRVALALFMAEIVEPENKTVAISNAAKADKMVEAYIEVIGLPWLRSIVATPSARGDQVRHDLQAAA
jgi:hypothetical protein